MNESIKLRAYERYQEAAARSQKQNQELIAICKSNPTIRDSLLSIMPGFIEQIESKSATN